MKLKILLVLCTGLLATVGMEAWLGASIKTYTCRRHLKSNTRYTRRLMWYWVGAVQLCLLLLLLTLVGLTYIFKTYMLSSGPLWVEVELLAYAVIMMLLHGVSFWKKIGQATSASAQAQRALEFGEMLSTTLGVTSAIFFSVMLYSLVFVL